MKGIYRIGILIPYFGKWPDWIHLYFETLRRNSQIDFIFFTDCNTTIVKAPNIHFHTYTFSEYLNLVNSKLDFDFKPENAYKICDLRPLFGHIHADVFKPYDFYGWMDVDLLLGNVREFYTDEVLSRFDVFSTHSHRISGHFALFRNDRSNRNKYLRIYQWREALLKKEFVGIDEHGITNAYTMTFWDKLNEKFKLGINNSFIRWRSALKSKRLYLKEQYTTPFVKHPWLDGSINSNQPDVWFYKDGSITNERDGERKFIYLHFMNFKSSLWRHDGTPAPWQNLSPICNAQVEDMIEGVVIDKNGIHSIKNIL